MRLAIAFCFLATFCEGRSNVCSYPVQNNFCELGAEENSACFFPETEVGQLETDEVGYMCKDVEECEGCETRLLARKLKSSKSSKSTKSPKGSVEPTPKQLKCCVVDLSDGSGYRRLLMSEGETIEENPSSERALEIIDSFSHRGATPDATFSKQHDLISKESCDALIEFVDRHITADLDSGRKLPVGRTEDLDHTDNTIDSYLPFGSGGVDNQYNKKLYAGDLVDLIGREETLKILEFFYDSLGDINIDCMYLARHGSKDNYTVPWHMDDYSTMEITLNDNYEGGDLLHLTRDGAMKTEARPGTATAHTTDIIHGITPNVGGAKYMLILKHHFDRPDKEGVVRINKEMVDELTR